MASLTSSSKSSVIVSIFTTHSLIRSESGYDKLNPKLWAWIIEFKGLVTMMFSFKFFGVLKLFVCLLCFISLNTKVSSTPFAYKCRNTTTYTANSTYKANLNILLSVLSNATRINGFSNFTAGSDPPGIVYGLFLCRGDVSTNDCHDCVVSASDEIVQYCPKESEAIVYYDNCLLRYSNEYIFSSLDYFAPVQMHNPLNVTDRNLLSQVLGQVMDDDLVSRAANDQSGKKFATKERNFTANQEMYGLAQCTPDLSSANCSKCLHDAISSLPSCCNGSQGARYLFASCNIRYELYPFYNANANATAPSPAPVFLPPPTPNPRSSTSGKGGISSQVLIAIIVPIGVSVLLFIMGLCFLSKKAKKKKYDTIEEDADGSEITAVKSLQYDLVTLQAATNNFSDDNKIGKGGFGDVYKGKFADGQEIAVKRLSRNSGQGAEEFKNEVVLVAKLQHRHLVRLLGFCLEGEEKILIYEFVSNKSLDYFLFDSQEQEKLDWSRRYKIIGGIARGMLYLHEDSRLRIIHRDLKTSNILLDEDMNAKISDFGMARIFGVDQTQGNTNRVVGTFGYMSPEYVTHGQYSAKSDVFSFGVLLLEIISGKKNTSFYQSDYAKDLLSYAWKLWRDRTPLDLIDPALEGSYSRNEVIRCIQIGLLCVQENPDSRPSMATVVLVLNSNSVTLSEPQQPAFFAGSRTWSITPKGLESDQSKSKSMPSSVNEASITELYPR